MQKCLVAGDPIGKPELDERNNWCCKIQWYGSGSRIEVLVAFVEIDDEKYLVIKDVNVF